MSQQRGLGRIEEAVPVAGERDGEDADCAGAASLDTLDETIVYPAQLAGCVGDTLACFWAETLGVGTSKHA